MPLNAPRGTQGQRGKASDCAPKAPPLSYPLLGRVGEVGAGAQYDAASLGDLVKVEPIGL